MNHHAQEPDRPPTRRKPYRLPLRPAACPLVAIVALGGLLRFTQIGSQGLWLDEAFSVWMARQPVGEMLGWVVRIDQHPPLYYLLLHLWIALGDDAATVRALSALLGALTIPVVYLLGRRLADDETGLLAGLILAISPFHVRFAQEARMYTLLTLNASLGLYALARLLTDPRSARIPLGQQTVDFWRAWRATRRWPPLRAIETDLAWLGYVLFTAATMWSHNTAVLFPIATNLFVFGLLLTQRRLRSLALAPPRPSAPLHPGSSVPSLPRPQSLSHLATPAPRHPIRPPAARNWLLAQAGVLLLWIPWLPAFVVQSMGVYREFWLPAPTWETVVGVVGAFLSDFLPWPLAEAWGVWGLYAALALLGLLHFRRHPARAALLLVIFATPLAGEWLVSLRRPIFYGRTLIWASLPLTLLLTAGVRQLRRQPHRLAAILLLLTINGLSLREYYVRFEKEQWDDAAAFVAGQAKPDDLILFNATWTQIPFDYYFHRLYNQPVAEHGVPVDLFDRLVLEPKMTESDLPRLRTLIRGHRRVWLVYSHDWYTDPRGLIPAALGKELDLLDRRSFYGLQVRLYGRPPP